ncbi:MAG: DUF4383 domain-containing protein [Nakamurella sp.]
MSQPRSTVHAGRTARHPVQLVALVVGIVFLLVGILGFVPGITTRYDDMEMAGHESMAMLLGIFMVSALHNVVHLLYGIVGVIASRTARFSCSYLIVGGVVYLVLWIFGLVVDQDSGANFVPLNTADNWLHLFLGIGMIGLGVLVGKNLAADRTDTNDVN